MKKEERAVWHYAVRMGRGIFMEPCCMLIREGMPRFFGDHGMTKIRGDVNCENCMRAMGMVVVDDYNHVGKYDALMVLEQPGTGNRWSVSLKEWVDPAIDGHWTSWIDTDERPELDEWLAQHMGELPEGNWVNINES